MRISKVLTKMRFLPPGLVSTFAIHFQYNTFCRTFIHSNFNVRTSHMFSLRDPYILFLEVILKFKSQSYKSQKKYLDFLLILSHLLNPYPTSILYTGNAYAFQVRCIFSIALQTILPWKHTLWAVTRLLPSAN